MNSLTTMETLRAAKSEASLKASLKPWKDSGKKIIGYTCIHVPEEIIDAAGALPVRIIQSCGEELEDANAYMSTVNCSFCRTVLQLAMNNELDFLDGIITSSTCECSRVLGDVWAKYVPIPVIGHVDVPRKWNDAALEHLSCQLTDLRDRVGHFLGTSITDEALAESVRLYNRGRELVGKLQELRKSATPPISGKEVLEVLNAACAMPRGEFNLLVQRLLEEIAATGRTLQADIRLMVSGSILNHTDFFAALEEFGGLVVVDALCSGIRPWLDTTDVDNGRSVIYNIASRYMKNPPCPTHSPIDERLDQIVRLAKEYRVDGFIFQKQRFCIPHTYDQPFVRLRLADEGISVLELIREYGTPGTGQVRTRVQAFMETILGKKSILAATNS